MPSSHTPSTYFQNAAPGPFRLLDRLSAVEPRLQPARYMAQPGRSGE
jgi:hypothetical protein